VQRASASSPRAWSPKRPTADIAGRADVTVGAEAAAETVSAAASAGRRRPRPQMAGCRRFRIDAPPQTLACSSMDKHARRDTARAFSFAETSVVAMTRAAGFGPDRGYIVEITLNRKISEKVF
jgi:hypothetical protein